MLTEEDASLELGRLIEVDPRLVWPHEAHDFTPWLLDNADVLGRALGMDLALERAEHRVGGFALDLLGVDEMSGESVIVENQLAQSDHGHLGQILTYAGGTDPVNVVWVALQFRDEHRAALEWLNSRTDEGTRFFAVRVSVVRIGDSPPAPLFEVVVQPNDWGKSVRAPSLVASERGEMYREFWAQWLARVRAQEPGWTNARKAPAANWMAMSTGVSSVQYGVAFTRRGLTCEIYLGSPMPEVNERRYQAALGRRAELEDAFGGALAWEELPERKASRILARGQGGIDLTDDWPEYLDWFMRTHSRLRLAVVAVGGMAALVDG
ncbi:MAG: DUF4268 domain-containing protein [Actinomycetales bacterium]|nr:DUF4268 domain-containing protein [Actinomycetales bacterium]